MLPSCPRCRTKSPVGPKIVKAGRFYRTSDSRWIQRYRCTSCRKNFSKASFDLCFRQKKRRKNILVFRLLGSGVSMRECARLLKINPITVERKKKFLSVHATNWLIEFRKSKKVAELQFDDMETFEHSKCKPLSITLAVEKYTRLILGFEVAQMPAKGLLVRKALKKYGPRPDHRARSRRILFRALQPIIENSATIESDQNPHYEPLVREFFPQANHIAFKGKRGCVVGQGELKGPGFDPLFSLNHTCAMFRANMNRLFRRTWCTTKKIEGLREHLAIYAMRHNQRILEKLT